MTANVENIRKWVEALRSGKYEQNTGSLRNADTGGFCCLGVACDISGIGEWETTPDDERVAYLVSPDARLERGYLPQPVVDWLGVEGRCPAVDGAALTTLNDNETPFAVIANLIEAEWLTAEALA